MFYLIYKITNTINGRFYIGAHKTENKDDGYMGSGVAIARAYKKYGKTNFLKEIILECATEHEMYAMEKELVIPYTKNKKSYNMTEGGKGGFSHISKEDRQRNTKKSWENSEIRNSRTEKIKEKRKLQVMGPSSLKGKTLENIHGDNANIVREKISRATSAACNTVEARERSKNKMLELWKDAEFKKTRSTSIKNGWSKGRATRSGLAHCRADMTIYEFVHESGLVEKCTRIEMKQKHDIGNISKLISGAIKSSMGWRIVK